MSFTEMLAQYAADVDTALARVFEEMSSRAASVHPGALEVAEAVTYFTSGPAKRLRPVLMRVAYEGLGGADTEAIVRASCAVELMQSFLLIHDDIMDRGDVRRGRPTLHRWYEGRHRRSVREAEHFGVAMAILAGDLADQWAALVLGEAAFPAVRVLRALACYHRIAVDVCYGQALDMLLPQRPLGAIGQDDVWKVMEYKTARYTVEGPLHLGCLLAGSDNGMLKRFSAYGLPVGQAFQIRDDVLGVFGQEAQTGKSAASDLREGKHTLLLAEGLKRADQTQRQRLVHVLGRPGASAEEVEVAAKVLEDDGARAHMMELARTLSTQAKQALAEIPLTAQARQFLIDLADYVVERER